MDYIKTVDSSKYVISLDSLDMGLLPLHTRFTNNTVSLWSNDLNSNNYFEFQVKNKTEVKVSDEDESSIDYDIKNPLNENQFSHSIPIEHTATTCHICDIDIPAAYVAEHENSLKHKAYVKIADIVLNRTRKHIVKKSNGYVQNSDSTYFCGPCASEVVVNNKLNHERSKAHKQSVSLDRLLYELVALLTDTNDSEELSPVLNEKFHDAELSKNEVVDNTVVISDVGTRLEELKINTKENYLKMVHGCVVDKPYTLSCISNKVKISMENGYEVIVAEDNFNGFIQIDENAIFCVMCKMIVEERNDHKISIAHIQNIITPFKDHHCVRNLENSLSDCMICNKIIKNTNLHLLGNKHIEQLQKALMPKENKPDDEYKNDKHKESVSAVHKTFGKDSNHNNLCAIKPYVTTKSDAFTKLDNDTSLCNPCNIKLHVNSIESHMNGSKHAMMSKSSVHYYMAENGGSNLICRVCNSYVADDVNEIKIHVATSEHVQKYSDLLTRNHVIRQETDFFCKPCDVVILKRNELFHIEKLKHENNLVNFKELPVEMNSAQNTNTNKLESNVALPAISNKSNLNTDAIIPVINDSNPTDLNTAYYCEICNVKVPNNPYNISGHNNGVKHKKNVSKAKEVVVDLFESNSTDDGSSDIHYQMDATDYAKSLMCKVCEVIVPNKEDSIDEHIGGKKHDTAFQKLMETNNIECVGENYFCKDCKVNIKRQNFFKHINQAKHKALMKNLQNLEVKPEIIKKVENPDAHAKENTNDKQTDDNTLDINRDRELIDKLNLEFKHHFTETEDKLWLKCKVCFDMEVNNSPVYVANHSQHKTHRDGYNRLMSDNFIFETEDPGYFCAVCVCLVPLKGEVHHAKGMRHMANYKSMPEGSREQIINVLTNQTSVFYCEYCTSLISKDKAVEHTDNCHNFAVKDKLCFCIKCDPYLPCKKKF